MFIDCGHIASNEKWQCILFYSGFFFSKYSINGFMPGGFVIMISINAFVQFSKLLTS